MTTFYRKLPRFEYLKPKTVDETVAQLGQFGKQAKLFAGGTDLFPQLKRRQIEAPKYVIDLKGIKDLDYIIYDERDGLKIGALATADTVCKSPFIQQKYNILVQAASSMASPQVRNRGTIAGNVCNAIPSADMVPSLFCLSAQLKLVSTRGERIVKIGDFFAGRMQTILEKDEFLEEIQIPPLSLNSEGIYFKLSPRRSMDLAVVGVAVLVSKENGLCTDAKITLGAVGPTAIRARGAELIIKGEKFNDVVIEKVAQTASSETSPISDHRASAEYRKDMVAVLVKRALNQLLV